MGLSMEDFETLLTGSNRMYTVRVAQSKMNMQISTENLFLRLRALYNSQTVSVRKQSQYALEDQEINILDYIFHCVFNANSFMY